MILTALAAATIIAACPWDAPRGVFAVTDVAPSVLVDNYKDIPAPVRAKLKARMDRLQFDEVVEIGKAGVTGPSVYSGLRDMHFGATGQKLCRQVTLAGWSADERERALIYTESGYSIAVPTVCRNVSRITRVGPAPTPPAPGLLTVDIPPALVPPVPVAADAPLPPVIEDALEPGLPRLSFARLGAPAPFTETPPTVDDEPLRISADQSFIDLYRPLLPPRLSRLFLRVGEPVNGPVVFVPVPGVKPVPVGSSAQQVPGIEPITSSVPPVFAPVVADIPAGDAPTAPVPESGTLLLMGLGMLGVWLMSRRRAR